MRGRETLDSRQISYLTNFCTSDIDGARFKKKVNIFCYAESVVSKAKSDSKH